MVARPSPTFCFPSLSCPGSTPDWNRPENKYTEPYSQCSSSATHLQSFIHFSLPASRDAPWPLLRPTCAKLQDHMPPGEQTQERRLGRSWKQDLNREAPAHGIQSWVEGHRFQPAGPLGLTDFQREVVRQKRTKVRTSKRQAPEQGPFLPRSNLVNCMFCHYS